MSVRAAREEMLALTEVPVFQAGMATAQIQSGIQVLEAAVLQVMAEIQSGIEVVERASMQIKRGMETLELWQQAYADAMQYPHRRKEKDNGG